MSRIHEALKKAQEERAAQQAARGTNSQEEPNRFPRPPLPRQRFWKRQKRCCHRAVAQPEGPITIEMLLARCRATPLEP